MLFAGAPDLKGRAALPLGCGTLGRFTAAEMMPY